MEFTEKLGAWDPECLTSSTKQNREGRLQIASQHLARWWDCEGMVHWEMLDKTATVNKELYIAQLHRVNEAIRLKSPDRHSQSILLHDNARSHVALVVKTANQELEREVQQHPPYSPYLARTDSHLSRSLSNHMKGVTFDNKEVLKNYLNNLFDPRAGDLWRNEIKKLVER